MSKEYEERKKNNPDSKGYRLFRTLIVIGLWIVGILFLLMVALPKGGWVDVFPRFPDMEENDDNYYYEESYEENIDTY